MSSWQNFRDGVTWTDAGVDDSGLLGRLWPTPLYRWHEASTPIIWRDSERREWHRLTRFEGVTDFGSVPGIVQALPNMSAERFRAEYTFHDDAYQSGQFHVSIDQGDSWALLTCTRQQADDRLRRMTLSDPDCPAWTATAWTIYGGLRAGGWVAWNRYRRRRA